MRTFFLLDIIILCFCGLTLILLFKNNLNYREYNKYEVIILEDDSLIVLAGIPQTFKMDEVESVAFRLCYNIRAGGFYGTLRIHLKNGKKSRLFQFHKTIYQNNNRVPLDREDDINQAINALIAKLEAHHIYAYRE